MLKVSYHNLQRMLYDNAKTGWVILYDTRASICRYSQDHPQKFHTATISKRVLKALHSLLPVKWRSLYGKFYTNQFAGKQLCLTYYGHYGSELLFKASCVDIPVPKKMNYKAFEGWADEVMMTLNCEVTKTKTQSGYLYLLTANMPQDDRLLLGEEPAIAASKKEELEEDVLERASSIQRLNFLAESMLNCSADDDFDRMRRDNKIPEELNEALADKLASMKDENDAVLFLHSAAIKVWMEAMKERV